MVFCLEEGDECAATALEEQENGEVPDMSKRLSKRKVAEMRQKVGYRVSSN